MSKLNRACFTALWLTMVLISLPITTAQAQPYQTPCPSYASFEPEANDLGIQGSYMNQVADGFHYFHTINVVNTSVGSNPTATVWDWYDILNAGNVGLLFTMAHSDFDRMDAAVYDLTTNQYNADYNALKAAFGSAALYKSTHTDENGTPIYRVIGVYGNFIHSYFRSTNTVVVHNGCGAWGLSDAYGAARAFCSYSDVASNIYMLDVTKELARRLVNSYSIPSQRVVDNAWRGISLPNNTPASLFQGRDIGTVLSPAVQSVTLTEGQSINAATTVEVVFDCPMNTNVSATSVVVGEAAISVSGWSWLPPNRLQGTVKGRYRGDGDLKFIASSGSPFDGLSSAYNVSLDGNTSPFFGPNCRAENQDDYLVNLVSPVGGDNPAAVCSALRVETTGSGVHIRMSIEVGSESESFFVQRSASPTGPFTEVVAWPANGPREYSSDDPSGKIGDWYEAWEIDSAGCRTRLASEQAMLPIRYNPDVEITEAEGQKLAESMLSLYPTTMASSAQTTTVLNWAAIIPSESWRYAIQPLANKHNADGLVSAIYTMVDINTTYGSIQNFAKAMRPNGLRFIVRCGDASNWRYHNNPLYYNAQTGWSYQGFDPMQQNDIMPVSYVLDPSGHMQGSLTYFTPEMPVIFDGDVDGDSLNEVAEGICPLDTPAQLAIWTYKDLKYTRQTVPANPHLTMYVDGRNLNGNDGVYAQQLADSTAAFVRKYMNVVTLVNNDSLNLPYLTRQTQAYADLGTNPTIVDVTGTGANRYNEAGFINKYMGGDLRYSPAVTTYPFYSGWICGQFSFDIGDDVPHLPMGAAQALFFDAMLDTLHGPACGIGAYRGTFIQGDYYAKQAFYDIILRHGAPSAGEAFVAALHKVNSQHPEYSLQYKGFGFFGDPANIIPGMVVNSTTAVDGPKVQRVELSKPYPNPVRGQASIRYTLPTSTTVTLSIIDVQGRVIHELASGTQSAGIHIVNFTSADVNPGMYFLRLRAGSETRTEKMVITR